MNVEPRSPGAIGPVLYFRSRRRPPAPRWGYSSAGRAFGWQPKGQGFESPYLHHSLLPTASRVVPRPHDARLLRRHRLDGHRDQRLPPPRPLLRLVDHRLGEHHRAHPGLAFARLLARRAARRPQAVAARARPARAGRRRADRRDPVRRPAVARGVRGGHRRRVGRRGRRLVRGVAAALRSARGAPRRRHAVRHQAGRRRGRRGRRHSPAASSRSRRWAASSAPFCRL